MDAAEADSWLSDRKPLLLSDDHGKDESSTAALLQRHQWLEKEMAAYASEIRRLWEQARSAAQLTALTVSVGRPAVQLLTASPASASLPLFAPNSQTRNWTLRKFLETLPFILGQTVLGTQLLTASSCVIIHLYPAYLLLRWSLSRAR